MPGYIEVHAEVARLIVGHAQRQPLRLRHRTPHHERSPTRRDNPLRCSSRAERRHTACILCDCVHCPQSCLPRTPPLDPVLPEVSPLPGASPRALTKEPFYTDQAALGEFWFGGMFSVNALCVAMAVQRVGVALLPLQLRRARGRDTNHRIRRSRCGSETDEQG